MADTIRLSQPKKRDRTSTEVAGLPTDPRVNRPAPPYIYAHYPQSWYWCDALDDDGNRYGWLPRPKKIIARPGVNGVQDPGYGRQVEPEHLRTTIGGIMRKGGRVIVPEDPRLGSYMGFDEFYDCKDGRKWYVEPGQEALIMPGDRIKWNTDEVLPAVYAFHAALRDTDLVFPLHREYFLEKMDIERKKLDIREQAAAATPGLAYRAEEQRKRIALMEEDFAAYCDRSADESKAIKPRRGGGTRKKPAVAAEETA